MSSTRNVTFQITVEQLARLRKEAYRRTVAAGRVVTQSEVIRDGVDHVCGLGEAEKDTNDDMPAM